MKNAVKEQLVLQFSLITGGNIPHISVEKEKFDSSEHQSCLTRHLQLLRDWSKSIGGGGPERRGGGS